MRNSWALFLASLLSLAIIFGLTCAVAGIVMVLWNWIMPIFGIVTLSFWQTWGLTILLNLLTACFRKQSPNMSYQELKELWHKKMNTHLQD